ncbi:uncharacterized protein EV422DRAFT_569566 [Fimicolochytrium jonesii]|uniref:uncharacterized protein n=1 Tax=Fimicolochytrium jonesii TaxID=1396493 RepID=UPI0022FEEF84|nr:uncharacterized protein EV422DRAFT_569566 [Fimicolochytrium jonesii]KAI8818514.1 hypothetical protein EV422DRAFT_569566 [Fimicolochytrium jonesii]
MSAAASNPPPPLLSATHHTPSSYDSYDDLLNTVTARVKDVLAADTTRAKALSSSTKPLAHPNATPQKGRKVKKVVPGARATLDDSDDSEEFDDSEEEGDERGDEWEEDGLGWELHDRPNAPIEAPLAFRNLSTDLIAPSAIALTSPLLATPPTPITPTLLRQTLAQLEHEFRSELTKSTMLVDLQHRYMQRRLAMPGGRGGGAGKRVGSEEEKREAASDILGILVEIMRGGGGGAGGSIHGHHAGDEEFEDGETEEAAITAGPTAIRSGMEDLGETNDLLLQLREHLERRSESLPEDHDIAAAAVEGNGTDVRVSASERSKQFARFLPTKVPSLDF